MQQMYIKNIKVSSNTIYSLFFIDNLKYLVVSSKNYNKQFLEIPSFFGISNISDSDKIQIYSFFLKDLKTFSRLFLKKWLSFKGVCRKVLNFKILGYKISLDSENLLLYLKFGFSHTIFFSFMKYSLLIKIKQKKKKLLIEGINKCEVVNFAKKIRDLRFPDPYKGKGIKYKNELIVLKKKKKKK